VGRAAAKRKRLSIVNPVIARPDLIRPKQSMDISLLISGSRRALRGLAMTN